MEFQLYRLTEKKKIDDGGNLMTINQFLFIFNISAMILSFSFSHTTFHHRYCLLLTGKK